MWHSRPDYNRIQDPAGIIPQDEPVFLLRAQDNCAVPTLESYKRSAKRSGCTPEFLDTIDRMIDRFRKWGPKKTPDLPE
jgi:hypothetical protein